MRRVRYPQSPDRFSWPRMRLVLVILGVNSVLLEFIGPALAAHLCQLTAILTGWFSGIHLLCTVRGTYAKAVLIPLESWKMRYGFTLLVSSFLGVLIWFYLMIKHMALP